MKKILLIAIALLIMKASFSQEKLTSDSLVKRFDVQFKNDSTRNSSSKPGLWSNMEYINDSINNAELPLMDLLIRLEAPTMYNEKVNPVTRRVIASRKDIYTLILLERTIVENLDSNLFLKEKLLSEISAQVNLLTKASYPYYTYETRKKQAVKFISIRSGNDLFTMAGLFSTLVLPKNQELKDGGIIFQRNDDRDYTGSLLIEVGTDYLNTLRRRPIKSYQTVLYGFDVYTPYFKKFTSDTSTNRLDRPHASFHYFGWSKKGLAKSDRYRWATTVKFGKIGGSAGAKFQNVLHQDISYSPRPQGWGAQIANHGRVGISFEAQQEIQFKKLHWHLEDNPNPDHFGHLYLTPYFEERLGTYMTTAAGGLYLTNKSFRQNNHNFINHRPRQTVFGRFHHLMYRVGFVTTYVKHNTMLEGYGIINTREKDADPLTPYSMYYMARERIRPFYHTFNIALSYTSRYATFFYNWKSISPETKNTNIGVPSPASGEEMNIANRWHHFAEIGLTFNLH